jgi:murein DD-endopeptidase MepM/ murein hydrolase activator NlpD
LKIKAKFQVITIFVLCITVLFSYSALGVKISENNDAQTKKYIKWMTFDIPDEAMNKAMNLDIKSYGSPVKLNWVEILAYLATKYGGHWNNYKAKDMDAVVKKLNSGTTMNELTKNNKYYNFYYEAYNAVLGNFLGKYKTKNKDGKLVEKYGLKVYSPIASGYGYSHYDDFGDSRSFGFRRPHKGNDIMGSIGTPIIAVESGVVEALGWNRYGGWRIGIRSFDHKRYYYYAHLRKNHPYVNNLKQGMLVKAGEVIGYLGMTGYSNKENVNNIKKPHLHFGMQIIFDESQKDGNNEIWIDVYDIVNVLSKNRSKVAKDTFTSDYYSTSIY